MSSSGQRPAFWMAEAVLPLFLAPSQWPVVAGWKLSQVETVVSRVSYVLRVLGKVARGLVQRRRFGYGHFQ